MRRSGLRKRLRSVLGMAVLAGLSLTVCCVFSVEPVLAQEGSDRVVAPDGVASPDTAAAENVGSEKSGKALRLIEDASGVGDGSPALKKKSKRLRAKGRNRDRAGRQARQEERPVEYMSRREAEVASGYRYPGWGGYPWAWGWHPWSGLPQTYVYRDYPPSITHVPRLGLQYNYPYAYQMGIRIPDDSSPLNHPPTLGPFVGVVQAAKEQLAREQELEQQREQELTVDPDDLKLEAVTLMQKGSYASAGKLLAAAFAVSDDPQFPFLLTEVFFALGKPGPAETLLRHGLRGRGAASRLPPDVAGHFVSRQEYEMKLKALAEGGKHDLLTAYLMVHSENPEKGIDLLGAMTTDKPEDKAAVQLYRRFLKKAISP